MSEEGSEYGSQVERMIQTHRKAVSCFRCRKSEATSWKQNTRLHGRYP